MCGIFGLLARNNTPKDFSILDKTIKKLAVLSESRGKESSGFTSVDYNKHCIHVLKGPVSASKMITHPFYRKYITGSLVQNSNNMGNRSESTLIFGHSRLVTNGSQLDDQNNQPTVKTGVVGIHNGIIVNETKIWDNHQKLKREYQIDTEVLFALIRLYFVESGNISEALRKTFREIYGTVSTAFILDDYPLFNLATNNGSLYILTNYKDILLFASEAYILRKVLSVRGLSKRLGKFTLKQIATNRALSVDYNQFIFTEYDLNNDPVEVVTNRFSENLQIEIRSVPSIGPQRDALVDIFSIAGNPNHLAEAKMLEYNESAIRNMKRCTRCLLPESFPFIEFDEKGICNICNNYKLKNQTKPLSVLHELVEPYRKKSGELDCIVPFSGGRDSSYSLHFIKKELGLNPLAFTYDWGMVTDLSRRNIARVCGKLGVENIIVSANIRKNRENIRKNVSAWLKMPTLGMVPLFMAGDKAFHYYVIRLKKQTGIKLNIWGQNNLENTDFKAGFAGVPLDFNKKQIYSVKKADQVNLYRYLLTTLLKNPAYINSSILDNIPSFFSRFYLRKTDYYNFFDYKGWDEEELTRTLVENYDWEMAIDTKTTWRIGDGTAPFYNYIYYTIAGFSEYETFRSNQIREGMLSREQGLELVFEENRPRYESIKWYLSIIGLDYETTIKRINATTKLYHQ